jgi:hypothetical protein
VSDRRREGGGGGCALSIFRIASSSSLRGDFGHRLIAGKNSIADLKHNARVTARLASPRPPAPGGGRMSGTCRSAAYQ